MLRFCLLMSSLLLSSKGVRVSVRVGVSVSARLELVLVFMLVLLELALGLVSVMLGWLVFMLEGESNCPAQA